MRSPSLEFLYPGSKLGTRTNFQSQLVGFWQPPYRRGGRFNYFLAKIPIFQRFSKTCGRKHKIDRHKSWTLYGHHFRWSFKNINKIFSNKKILFSELEITHWELRTPKSGFAPNFFFLTKALQTDCHITPRKISKNWSDIFFRY